MFYKYGEIYVDEYWHHHSSSHRPGQSAGVLYTEKLGFEKRTDQTFGPDWRWLTIAPKDQKELEITLMKPDATMVGEEKAKALTQQIGMAPPWSYSVDDCRKTYETLLANGVKFTSPPTEQF